MLALSGTGKRTRVSRGPVSLTNSRRRDIFVEVKSNKQVSQLSLTEQLYEMHAYLYFFHSPFFSGLCSRV